MKFTILFSAFLVNVLLVAGQALADGHGSSEDAVTAAIS